MLNCFQNICIPENDKNILGLLHILACLAERYLALSIVLLNNLPFI